MIKTEKDNSNDNEPRIVGFVCNWGAYSGIEMAGIDRIAYPASVTLIRLPCLGRLHLGLILKAFDLGADGVILLGCPTEDCHYESGMERTKELFTQARKTLHLLGIDSKRLDLADIPLGRGDILARRLSAFAKYTTEISKKRLRLTAKAASNI